MEANMFITDVINFFKWLWLHITRGFRHAFKHIEIKLSMFLVIFSFLISMFFLIPSLFSRVPVFSYLINTLSLPLSYEFECTIVLVDAEGEPVNQTVTVYVGGYSVDALSGETFILDFASNSTDCFYVTIEYEDQVGSQAIITKRIETNGKMTLKEVIRIYV